MRASWLRLYAPFLVLALVQGLFIAVAPSRGGGDQALSTFGGSSTELTEGGAVGSVGGGPLAGGPGATGASGRSGPSGAAIGGAATSGGQAAGAAGGAGGQGGQAAAGGGGGAAAASGDTSHCTEDGKQFAVIRDGGPPCAPKWPDGADNGGDTYRGVTGDEITVVFFSSEPNEQVNAVLRPQGLAVTEEEQLAAAEAYVEFINARYETYGRTVKMIRVVGDCPTSPPDVDACIAAAQEVVKLNPFAVIWATSLYASVYDVWAKNGIISLGGNHFDERFFSQRRPFRYDTSMDGTQSADHIAEYYCKKMAAGRPPTPGGSSTPRSAGATRRASSG